MPIKDGPLCHHCRLVKPLPRKWCGMFLCRRCRDLSVAQLKRASAILRPAPPTPPRILTRTY